MDRMVIVDVQTRLSYDDVGGKKGMNKMGISVAGLYDYSKNELTLYSEQQLPEFINVIQSSTLLFGVNLKRFVLKFLSSILDFNINQTQLLDLIDHLKKRLSFRPTLEGLFQGTLGIKKEPLNDNYIPRLFKQGKIDEIRSICEENILDLKKLYDYGRAKGYIIFEDKTGQRWKISVEW